MNRLFGSKSTASKPTLNDALGNIDERVSSLDIKLTKLNAELSGYQQKLARMRDGPGKQSLKQRAMQLLKQRRMLESQKAQLENQSWNITQTQITTDNLKNSLLTYDVMKQTHKELKKSYGKVDVDKVMDLQDEMMDMMDVVNEVQVALGASYDVPEELSEGELDAELEALGEEIEWEQEQQGVGAGIGEVPSYLMEDEIPTFVDEDAEKPAKEAAS